MSWYRIELDSVVIYKFGWIQTSQTGGQPYSDTSPYESKWVFSGWRVLITPIGKSNKYIVYQRKCWSCLKFSLLDTEVQLMGRFFTDFSIPQNTLTYFIKNFRILTHDDRVVL